MKLILMSIKKLCIVFCTLAVMTLVGCGDDTDSSLNYEQPINTMKAAINNDDEIAYLSCWFPYEKASFENDESYEEGFLSAAFDKSEYLSRMRAAISDSDELDDVELSELEADAKQRYGVRVDFTKALALNVEFSVQTTSGTAYDERELYVVRYENVWYAYGEIIDSFEFTSTTD
ncbi:MAG: hypothetical protein LUI06_07680 [Ruminococcus sp.]|nr:hypothetical protein [Ruminococcus sp.]